MGDSEEGWGGVGWGGVGWGGVGWGGVGWGGVFSVGRNGYFGLTMKQTCSIVDCMISVIGHLVN